MSRYNDLVVGAIDLHCHVDLEFGLETIRKVQAEWEWLPLAEAMGIRAFVLKSHWWPTAPAVHYLKQLYDGPVKLIPSITLNPIAGGPTLYALESAVAMGCRMVFLPTWSADGDLRNQGMSSRIAREFATFEPSEMQGLRFSEDGDLSATGHEVLRYCHDHDLVLATGHISPAESLLFAAEASSIGFEGLVFSHPMSHSVQAPLEAAQRAASLGSWIEFPWTLIAPGRLHPEQVVASIRGVGIERSFVSTDHFRPSSPAPPHLLRSWLGELLDGGLDEQEIEVLVARNPASVLGWPQAVHES